MGAVYLEDELAEIAETRLRTAAQAAAVLASLGGASGEPATLAEVGDRTGYSREGVRHCLLALRRSLAAFPAPAPLLKGALALMAEVAPCVQGAYSDALVARGLARGPFPAPAVFRWADMLSPGASIPVRLWADGALLPQSLTDLYRRLPMALRKQAAHHGAAHVDRCAGHLAEPGREELLLRLIPICVECDASLRWIDAGSGWFWVPGARSPMLTDVKKLLAVCPEVQIESLSAGISRFYRRHGSVPPLDVLIEWCRQVEGLCVSGSTVTAKPPLDPQTELAAEELRLYDLLRAHGGVMSAGELQREWVAQGANPGTLRVLRMNAPFVRRSSARLYALREPEGEGGGQDFGFEDRGRAQALSNRWTPDGRVLVSYRLTPRKTTEPLFPIPYVLRKVLGGEFHLTGEGGEDLGVVEVRIPGGLRLDALFAIARPREGMILELEFDLAARSLHAVLRDSG